VIFERYNFVDRSDYAIKNIFVTQGRVERPHPNGPWHRLQEFCNNGDIELIEINTIIKGLIAELRHRYPRPDHVGSEKGIARFLLHLIQNDFLKGQV